MLRRFGGFEKGERMEGPERLGRPAGLGGLERVEGTEGFKDS